MNTKPRYKPFNLNKYKTFTLIREGSNYYSIILTRVSLTVMQAEVFTNGTLTHTMTSHSTSQLKLNVIKYLRSLGVKFP